MSTREAVRADALFASCLQASQRPADTDVRAAVVDTLGRLGETGCAGEVAVEFGDHPEYAAHRMTWALDMIDRSYRD
ncbi:hypothetical protein J2S43_005078 [Catenuloplanes nepalensis]|uniref:HEAT repeat domain-containing protein n=1 Tax=Catenuloplanes nepalensis TaxID=587533 RepID=A0ABT9MZY0_9ACTN|nr:hypothetical protein [Catenuloplanes nepalensis]MDP9796566.1 hypothetical protein [Catenuloplanes nepalensis]